MNPDLPAQVGEEIAGYQLRGILGRGGMGCVFEAVHTKLGRRSALKFLASELLGSEEYVKRFLSEARIVNSVRHPNIVDIYDFLELQNPKRVAYVMEFVDGRPMGAVLKARRLSVRQAINVTFQLADALEAVHARGVVHRDLKPDNILVIQDLDGDLSSVPSVKILDFGIAKAEASSVEHRTMTGAILGTPAYMAPEQVAGHEVSAATDIYALGEIFYEMVSGRRLFRGDRIQMMTQKLGGQAPDLALADDIEGASEIRELVARCLCVQADQRPTMTELAGRLTTILNLQSDLDATVTPRPEVRRPPMPLSVSGHAAIDPAPTPMAMASVAMLPPPSAPPNFLRLAGVALLALGVGVGGSAYFLAGTTVNAVPLALEKPPGTAAEPAPRTPARGAVAPEGGSPPVEAAMAPDTRAAAKAGPAPTSGEATANPPKTNPGADRPRRKAKDRPRRRRARRSAASPPANAGRSGKAKTSRKPERPKAQKPTAAPPKRGAIIEKETIPSW